jgi:branched-chain amino acid transport system permease protein
MLGQQLINALTLGSVYALIALGFSLVFSVLEIVNFSYGALLMSGVFISASLVRIGLGVVPAVLITCAIVAALGVVIERVAVAPLRRGEAHRVLVLVSTIGAAMAIEALAMLVWGGEVRGYPIHAPQGHVTLGAARISYAELIIVGLSLLLMIGLQLFVGYTRPGRAIRATAQNAKAAALMGIDVDGSVRLVFALGSALAAVAGILMGTLYNVVHPSMGLMPGIKGFVAAVLGGMGSVAGAGVGGLVLGLAEVFGGSYVSFAYQDAVSFLILIVIFLVRPQGLFGTEVLKRI